MRYGVRYLVITPPTSANSRPRLTRKNTGAGEWSAHCVDCVKLARQARSGKDLPSAKIRTMLKLLKHVDRKSKGEEKTIIFSQFTKMLDVIEPFLKQKGIDYVRCKFFFSSFPFCRYTYLGF